MGDLISREAVRHALCKAVHKGEDIPCENQTASCLWSKTRICDYVREIDALPSVQSKVIHCIDCRYACIEKDRESNEVYCSNMDFYPSDNFYCGYAKEREGYRGNKGGDQ